MFKHLFENELTFKSVLYKLVNTLFGDEFYIVFKRLVTLERVLGFAVLAMLFPFIACAVLVALPAELDAFFLDGAGDEGAAHAAAVGTCLVPGIEDAGEATYFYGWKVDIHDAELYL